MGGLLFATGPDAFTVPRLSPDLYRKLKSRYITLLKAHYNHVTTPAEAPGKSSHGDIDIMVSYPLVPLKISALAPVLQATRHSTNGPTTSFAVPHPEEEGSHVQLDVHVCEPGRLAWEAFEHSYGDMWQILGVCIRPLGFTATDKGFHVRVAELEASDRKASMMFLTGVPSETMDFLGLDVAAYKRGFETEEQLFTWITEAPFFGVRRQSDRSNATDRQRRAKRGMFVRFVDEFVVKHHAELRENAGAEWTRETALTRALNRFGKQKEYQSKMADHAARENEKSFWTKVAQTVPEDEGDKLNLVIRALKRWVAFESEEISIRVEADMSGDSSSKWLHAIDDIGEEKLLVWIGEKWEIVKDKEKRRVKKAKEARASMIRAGYTTP